MICPACGHDKSTCTDSRPRYDGTIIRRRRKCSACEIRWTTHERLVSEWQDSERGYRLNDASGLLFDFEKLAPRWRSVARDVIRGLLARQETDRIKGKDAA